MGEFWVSEVQRNLCERATSMRTRAAALLFFLGFLCPSDFTDSRLQEGTTTSFQPTRICVCTFVAPTYSALARQVGIQGTVHLKVQVDSTGTPGNLSVVTVDHPILQELATTAVKKWRFCPPPTAGATSEVPLTFIFKFDGKPTESWWPTNVIFDGAAYQRRVVLRLLPERHN